MQVLVLGAGIAGLTSALELSRAGHEVGVFARERSPDTNSDVAAAFFYPFLAKPRDKVLDWGRVSLREYGRLTGIDGTGVRWGDVLELHDEPVDEPWWASMVEDFRPAPDEILPPGAGHGTLAHVPIIDMRSLMPWLTARVEQAGVLLETGEVPSLEAVGDRWDAIVNCTGMGARRLARDQSLVPVRGQVVYTEDPGLERVVLDQRDPDELAYIVPFGSRAVLGGTVEEGIPEPETEQAALDAILERCRRLEPRLEGCNVLGSAAGIRPYRPAIRVEREQRPGVGPVVHNYGHGGAGVTVAWGCAREVVHRVGR